MTFEGALQHLKNGARVYRPSWAVAAQLRGESYLECGLQLPPQWPRQPPGAEALALCLPLVDLLADDWVVRIDRMR